MENKDVKKQLAVTFNLYHKLEIQPRRNNMLFGNIGKLNERDFYEDSEECFLQFDAKQLKVYLNSTHLERFLRLGCGHKAPIIVILFFEERQKYFEILSAKTEHVTDNFVAFMQETVRQLSCYMRDTRSRENRAKLQYKQLYINSRTNTLDDLRNLETNHTK